MKFKRDTLLDVLNGPRSEILRNEIVDTSRWSTCYDFVFRRDGKLYQTSYCRGSTEMQEESPWENDGDEIECAAVEAYEKTVTDYRPVSEAQTEGVTQ